MKHAPTYLLVAACLLSVGALNAQAQQPQVQQPATGNDPASAARAGGTAPGRAGSLRQKHRA